MDDKDRTLYCGNLSEKVTEDLLYELFLQAGPLESVSIPKEKDGRQKNFGFVKFKHAVSVQYSVALMDGVALFGKTLRLDVRSGSASGPNPYLEKLRQYQRTHQSDHRVQSNSRPRQQDSRQQDSRRHDARTDNSRSQYAPRNIPSGSYAGYNQQYMLPQSLPVSQNVPGLLPSSQNVLGLHAPQNLPGLLPGPGLLQNVPQGYPMNYGMYPPNQWGKFR